MRNKISKILLSFLILIFLIISVLSAEPSIVTGILDDAYDFDGTDTATIEFNTLGIFDGSEDFTVSMWVNPDSIIGEKGIFTTYGENYIIIQDSQLKTHISSNWRTETYTLATGTWTHLVVVYNHSTGFKIYQDTINTDSLNYHGTITAITTGTNALGSYLGNANSFDGIIDETIIFNKVLSSTEISDLYQSGTPTEKVVNVVSDSVYYNPMGHDLYDARLYLTMDDDDLNVSNPLDISGNNVLITNNGAITGVTGYFNETFDFDGGSDYLVSNNDITLDTQMSIVARFKTTTAGSMGIFSHAESSASKHVLIGQNGDEEIIANFYDGGTTFIGGLTSPLTYNDGDWHTMVVTQDDDTVKLYIDNSLVDTDTTAGKIADTQLMEIGSYYTGTSSNFDGNIDEFVIYDRPLSVAEINEFEIATGNPYEAVNVTPTPTPDSSINFVTVSANGVENFNNTYIDNSIIDFFTEVNSTSNNNITLTYSLDGSSYISEGFMTQYSYLNWISDDGIVDNLPSTGDNDAVPTVFEMNSVWYLIFGDYKGEFTGYHWDTNTWVSDSSIVAGLIDVGLYSAPTVFEKDSVWYLITGEQLGTFQGYHWVTNTWVSNSSVVAGLTDIGYHSKLDVFEMDSVWYLIAGSFQGLSEGYHWDTNTWVSDNDIIKGLTDVGTDTCPAIFEKDNVWYLILGEGSENFNGYYWNTNTWVSESQVITGLDISFGGSTPTIFEMDNIWYLISGEDSGDEFFGFQSIPTNFYNTFNLTLSNQLYTILFNVTNNETSVQTPTYTFTVDTIYPTVSFVGMQEVYNDADRTVSLRAQVVDTNIDTCEYKINSEAYASCNTSSTLWLDRQFDVDETNILYIRATDLAGNINISSYEFITNPYRMIITFKSQLNENPIDEVTFNDIDFSNIIDSNSSTSITLYHDPGAYSYTANRDRYIEASGGYTIETTPSNYIQYLDIFLFPTYNITLKDEKTWGLFNLSKADSVTLNIICDDDSVQQYDITTNNHLINITCVYKKFIYTVSNSDEYFRTIQLDENNLDFDVYLIDLDDIWLLKTFVIYDYLGEYINPSLSLYRNIGDELVQITGDFINAENKLTTYLLNNQQYTLILTSDNKPERNLGLFDAVYPVESTHSISLLNLESITIPEGYQIDDIIIYPFINKTTFNLYIRYIDNTNTTTNVQLDIYKKNKYGENIYSTTGSTSNILFSLNNLTQYNTSSVYIKIIYTTDEFGIKTYYKTLRVDDSIDLGITFDHLNINWVILILLGFFALILTAKTANIGSIILLSLGGIASIFGWFTISTTLISISILVAIIAFFREADRK